MLKTYAHTSSWSIPAATIFLQHPLREKTIYSSTILFLKYKQAHILSGCNPHTQSRECIMIERILVLQCNERKGAVYIIFEKRLFLLIIDRSTDMPADDTARQ